MNKSVSIVILNYKNYHDTIECLETVYQIAYDDYCVIVVDNDSQNESLKYISKWLDGVGRSYVSLTQGQSQNDSFVDSQTVLIQSDSNRGYAAGNNIGIRWAVRGNADYILILNNDTLVEKEFVGPLVSFLGDHSDTAIAGPVMMGTDGNIQMMCARRRPGLADYFFRIGFGRSLFPNNRWLKSRYYFQGWDLKSPKQVDVIAGSCMLIRTSFLKEINFLDEHTFLMAEEYILAEQARNAGLHTGIVPSSRIVHKHGESIKKVSSLFMIEHVIKSHTYYLTKIRKLPSLIAYCMLWNWHLMLFVNKHSKEEVKK